MAKLFELDKNLVGRVDIAHNRNLISLCVLELDLLVEDQSAANFRSRNKNKLLVTVRSKVLAAFVEESRTHDIADRFGSCLNLPVYPVETVEKFISPAQLFTETHHSPTIARFRRS